KIFEVGATSLDTGLQTPNHGIAGAAEVVVVNFGSRLLNCGLESIHRVVGAAGDLALQKSPHTEVNRIAIWRPSRPQILSEISRKMGVQYHFCGFGSVGRCPILLKDKGMTNKC
uniref:Uncharacterized protein n=1 Tax=Caenorhabditis japonica TaxID=281687 RepID=A0A8R1IQX0_CAEJA